MALALVLSGSTGCTWMSYLGTDERGSELGRTYFVGGAGFVGHVTGTLAVPKGLRQAGYRGAIEVFGWQSVVGGTLRDQMDRSRNEGQAHRLAERIRAYVQAFPDGPVDIIALSAGTGVVTWALESLPEDVRIRNVVYLGSSLSRRYDLSEALRRLEGRLYNFYSSRDAVLRYGMPIAGSVDGELGWPSVAGLYGFALPPDLDDTGWQVYRQRLRNRPYKSRYARFGYRGQHTDATSPEFIARIVTPLLSRPPEITHEDSAARAADNVADESPDPPPSTNTAAPGTPN